MKTNHSNSVPDDDPVANDWRITAYVFNQLDDDERKSVEQLMSTDPAYRRAVEQTEVLAKQLQTESSEIPCLSAAGISHIEAAIDTGSPVLAQSNSHRGRWLTLVATAASLLVVGSVWWLPSSPLAFNSESFQGYELEGPEKDNSLVLESGDSVTDDNRLQDQGAVIVDKASSLKKDTIALSKSPYVELEQQQSKPEELRISSPKRDYGLAQNNTEGKPGLPINANAGAALGYGEGMGSGYGQSIQWGLQESNSKPEMGRYGGMGGASTNGMDDIGGYGGGMGGMEGYGGPYRGGYGGAGYGDTYQAIIDNAFETVIEQPLSTFSIDVDTASYSKIRMMLQKYNQRPQPNAVRIEEMLNYFSYNYTGPEGDEVPFAANMELATCPWDENHKLARIAIKGREVETDKRTVSNLVFLLDVSGSMNDPDKLPLVRRGLEMLVQQLGENDRVAIVVYAGAAGMVLDSTTADQKAIIFESLDRLQAGGSTNGAQGIQLAYQLARDHFIKGGTNRVILCTDGDFNVGVTGTEGLAKMVEQEAKGGVFLSVLGFGTGNLNDAMLEAISGRGDGNYAFIDSTNEAHKVLVDQLSGTLVAIAKDVKIQIEFNPSLVESYRLIGYENRVLAAKDFADDTKDAGEIGAGHTVTALYEIVPVGAGKSVADLKYQPKPKTEVVQEGEYSDELLTLKLRYKQPEGGASKLLEFPIKNADVSFAEASDDFRFASAVAGFGMLLRNSEHRGTATFESVRQIARDAVGKDEGGLRSEFISLVDAAKEL